MPKTYRASSAMADTVYNRRAADHLRAARLRAKCSQSAFAVLLSQALGFDMSASSLSYWESAKHEVPGPVLLGAAALSGQPIRVERVKVHDLWKAIGESIQRDIDTRRATFVRPDSRLNPNHKEM